MTEQSVETMVRKNLDKFQLHDWKVEINNTKRILGRCWHQRKTIQMSKAFFASMNQEDILDVVLHEIAHALVGPGHGHDATWKAMAVRLGADPSARTKRETPSAIERGAKWVLVTPKGVILQSWFRKPQPQTFAKVPYQWERDNKQATYGKLRLITVKEYQNGL